MLCAGHRYREAMTDYDTALQACSAAEMDSGVNLRETIVALTGHRAEATGALEKEVCLARGPAPCTRVFCWVCAPWSLLWMSAHQLLRLVRRVAGERCAGQLAHGAGARPGECDDRFTTEMALCG
jgi:hypothetical protein